MRFVPFYSIVLLRKAVHAMVRCHNNATPMHQPPTVTTTVRASLLDPLDRAPHGHLPQAPICARVGITLWLAIQGGSTCTQCQRPMDIATSTT